VSWPAARLGELVSCPAIVAFVLLGNVGLPVPEESILVLSGYLAWRGDLRLPLVIAVGVLSAAGGDNIGFWIGRRYGRAGIERYGHLVLVTPERLEKAWRFVNRYGAVALFAARFLPGVRFLPGPLAGAAGLRPSVFMAANLLGAMTYVPYAVGIGYAAGYGAGEYVERLRHVLGRVEHVVLIGTACGVALLLGRRALHAARRQQ
jgi:membrane protein DedA with SNARE-associated domain